MDPSVYHLESCLPHPHTRSCLENDILNTDILTILLFVISLSMVMTQEGWTALYMASHQGHETVVRLLLEKGADVSICDKVVTV